MNESNNETMTQQDDHEDGKLAAEAARRRVQAREANERADAAEQEAAQLRAQIAELRLSQARTAVTAAHPELTAELIEKYAPNGVDADGLEDWATKTLALVVALRGEAVVDADSLTEEERQLAETQLELARVKAVAEHEHVTDDVLTTLCAATTPEGLTAWAADYERLAGGERPKERKPVPHNNPNSPTAKVLAGMARQPSGSSSSKPHKGGLENVAQKLTNR